LSTRTSNLNSIVGSSNGLVSGGISKSISRMAGEPTALMAGSEPNPSRAHQSYRFLKLASYSLRHTVRPFKVVYQCRRTCQ
jgi:hypothetical protein